LRAQKSFNFRHFDYWPESSSVFASHNFLAEVFDIPFRFPLYRCFSTVSPNVNTPLTRYR
jgi:hypothetical protein